jgi:protein SCO1/2
MEEEARDSGTGVALIPLLRGLLFGLAVTALLAIAFVAARHYLDLGGRDRESIVAEGGSSLPIGGPFTLLDQDGSTVTDQHFRGRWLLVYFGYTACPDVCPTALGRNGEAIDLLGRKGDEVVPVLITVDPERDTPEKLKDYVHFFHPRTVGLTGSPDQIARVAKEYRVFYAKEPRAADGSYLVDHSSLTYLVGRDGRVVQFFGQKVSPQELADRLSKLL